MAAYHQPSRVDRTHQISWVKVLAIIDTSEVPLIIVYRHAFLHAISFRCMYDIDLPTLF
jgi:hypothetical protein